MTGLDGNDQMVGRGGADSFWFYVAPDPVTNMDEILDFNVAEDMIGLLLPAFPSVSDGDLPAGEFVVGAAAQDGDDYIIYNAATGALLYDDDGAGGAAAIQFALLDPGLNVTHQHFHVWNGIA
jgi:Ca2+-binding RTX toxin-like protein